MSQAQAEAVVLLSGGLDSMVAAGLARERGFALNALTIDYEQRHTREIASAGMIAEALGARRHVVLPLNLRLFGGSALTDDIAVPKEGLGDDIPVTYVPARNLIFLSLTLAWAEAIGAHDIFIGVNALDYSGYPDCRPEFIEQFTKTANLGTRDGDQGRGFTVHTPLQYWDKAQIVRECNRLGLDAGLSWSCYDPGELGQACGLCDSCRLRLKGFREAGCTDPLPYAVPPEQGPRRSRFRGQIAPAHVTEKCSGFPRR
jgi:7-cyano-7-deazaguanine synthase